MQHEEEYRTENGRRCNEKKKRTTIFEIWLLAVCTCTTSMEVSSRHKLVSIRLHVSRERVSTAGDVHVDFTLHRLHSLRQRHQRRAQQRDVRRRS